MKKWLGYLLVCSLLFGLSPAAQAEEPEEVPAPPDFPQLTRIRLAHFAPDTPPVEVYLNGIRTDIQVLYFGNVTGWIEVPAGRYTLALVPVDQALDDAVVGPITVTLPRQAWQTFSVIGTRQGSLLRVSTLNQDFDAPITGTRLTLLHAISDAPAVDVLLPDNTPLVRRLRYGNSVTIDVPAGSYDLRVVPSSAPQSTVLTLNGVTLEPGNDVFVAAIGTLNEEDAAAPEVSVLALSQDQVRAGLNLIP